MADLHQTQEEGETLEARDTEGRSCIDTTQTKAVVEGMCAASNSDEQVIVSEESAETGFRKLRAVFSPGAERASLFDMMLKQLSSQQLEESKKKIQAGIGHHILIEKIERDGSEIFLNFSCLTEESLPKLNSKEKEKLANLVTGTLFGQIAETCTWETTFEEMVDETQQEGHIMISYCWAQQELVLKIYEALKDAGYIVWIDVKDMGGKIYEAMTKAIDNASVVLICMSDGYQESDNCEKEAVYAKDKKKLIIPLKVEKGYKLDGWLQLILQNRLWCDFTQPDISAETARLFQQLKKCQVLPGRDQPVGSFDVLDRVPETSASTVNESALKTLLARHQAELVASIETEDGLWDHLIAAGVVIHRTVKRFRQGRAREAQVSELLSFLNDKTDESIKKFIEALRKTGQEHLAHLLEPC